MLDLSANALTAILLGPLVVFILAMAGWSLRRVIIKQDEEMKNMATTQKEFDKLILNVLLMQSQHDQRLEAGFQRMSADMEIMKSGMQANMDNMKTGMQTDMDNMKSNVTRLESELRDHRAAMDKEIAVIRERISRNGSP